jgi:hypothetical protein
MESASVFALPEAPGARAARICGILAIVLALTCLGIPVALVLGIVALVQHSKAKRLARAEPLRWGPVSSTGLVTGIIGLVIPVLMLPVTGIVAAIAIPALLGQRERARNHLLEAQWKQVQVRADAVVKELWTADRGHPPTGEEVIDQLLADPVLGAMRNAADPGQPVLMRGTAPVRGAIALSPEREEDEQGTTWSVCLRAQFGPGASPTVREEKIQVAFVGKEPPQDAAQGWRAEPQPPPRD